MPQEPDKDGRIIVSKKINAEEWARTVRNCRKLPGRVTLDKYSEGALKRENDWRENATLAESTGWQKMLLVCEDLESALERLEERDAEDKHKDKLIETLTLKLEKMGYEKKVQEKVDTDIYASD